MKRALVVVLVLIAACSDGDDDKRADATTSTASTPSTTTTAAACFTFEEVDRGASVTVFGVFDCDGAALTLDGAAAAFPVGGTVTHAEGMRCEDDALVVLSAVSDDGETFQGIEKTYAVEGGELVLIDESGSTLDASEAQPYYELDCPTP